MLISVMNNFMNYVGLCCFRCKKRGYVFFQFREIRTVKFCNLCLIFATYFMLMLFICNLPLINALIYFLVKKIQFMIISLDQSGEPFG